MESSFSELWKRFGALLAILWKNHVPESVLKSVSGLSVRLTMSGSVRERGRVNVTLCVCSVCTCADRWPVPLQLHWDSWPGG